jgi:hypothetical protein
MSRRKEHGARHLGDPDGRDRLGSRPAAEFPPTQLAGTPAYVVSPGVPCFWCCHPQVWPPCSDPIFVRPGFFADLGWSLKRLGHASGLIETRSTGRTPHWEDPRQSVAGLQFG